MFASRSRMRLLSITQVASNFQRRLRLSTVAPLPSTITVGPGVCASTGAATPRRAAETITDLISVFMSALQNSCPARQPDHQYLAARLVFFHASQGPGCPELYRGTLY